MEGSQEAQFYVKENWMAGIYEFQLQVQVVSLYHLWQNVIGKNILLRKQNFVHGNIFSHRGSLPSATFGSGKN